jgi:hypothetical protein
MEMLLNNAKTLQTINGCKLRISLQYSAVFLLSSKIEMIF